MMKVGDRALVVKTHAEWENHYVGLVGTVKHVHPFNKDGEEVYQLKFDDGEVAEFYADEVAEEVNVYQETVDSLSQAIADKAAQMAAPVFLDEPSRGIAFHKEGDVVQSPSHYVNSAIEPIEYMADKLPAYSDGHTAFCVGNVIKYVSRAPHKGKLIEDLEKAAKYLEFAIKHEKDKL